jgi:hypothetical protein
MHMTDACMLVVLSAQQWLPGFGLDCSSSTVMSRSELVRTAQPAAAVV